MRDDHATVRNEVSRMHTCGAEYVLLHTEDVLALINDLDHTRHVRDENADAAVANRKEKS